jgi:hypothetical protein
MLSLRELGRLAHVDIKRVPELVPEEIARKSHYKLDQVAPIAKVEDLAACDAIIIGAGTRFGRQEKRNVNRAGSRLNGYVFDGAGEVLVWSAADFEDFMAPRPELKPQMERELAEVIRLVADKQWPIRQHATYDQSISRILDVFEPIFKETGYRARWGIDHAETISPRNIARIKAMGGGIAIQDRMAFAGEFFAERYGPEAAAHAPPIRQMLDTGLTVGAGTDATRVASYNP